MQSAEAVYGLNPVNTRLKIMDISHDEVTGLLKVLSKHEVKYLLVGGMAVVFHGYIRTTQDLDIWVKKDENNQSRLSDALAEMDITGAEYLKNTQLVMGYTSVPFGEHGFTLDMGHELSFFKEHDFDTCYERAVIAEIEGTPFRVIHMNDLIREKEHLSRLKDQLDVEELKKLKS